MLYVSIQPKQIKLLNTKKSVLGSVETTWQTYTSPTKLITSTGYTSAETLSSSLSNAIGTLQTKHIDSQVTVVIDHALYSYARIVIPSDIIKNQQSAYILEKLETVYKIPVNEMHIEQQILHISGVTTAFVYCIRQSDLISLTQTLELLKLTLAALVPEQAAYYALFEKTVRFDKKEQILYAIYEGESLTGYYFDTFGPLSTPKSWSHDNIAPSSLESTLREKAEGVASKGDKLNRIIMSGSASEKIRQDTFTKNVGVWTNPLKRIIPNFYQDYIEKIHSKTATDLLPVLSYDALFGAYVCHADDKSFSSGKMKASTKVVAFKQTVKSSSSKPMDPLPSYSSPRKSVPYVREVLLFLVIFGLVFGLVSLFTSKSEVALNLPSLLAQATPTPLPTVEPTLPPPTPTPTIAVKREEFKVRVLNGTGVRGQATGLTTALKDKKYASVIAGNAASFDYAKSEINIKKSKIEMLKSTITEDVKDTVTTPTFGELADNDTVDIEIILGKDAK